jgi:putative addiction module killer protein
MSRPAEYRILHYLTLDGKDLYEEWLEELDRSHADRIDAYVTRMERGNFGVTRTAHEGVLELKIEVGPGYRVYYLRDQDRIVVLLCGGNKGSQTKDIVKAKIAAVDYWRRK